MTPSETCVLTFVTSLGRQKTLRINNPRPGISADAITAAANSIAQVNAFDSTVGNLTQLIKANVISQTVTRRL